MRILWTKSDIYKDVYAHLGEGVQHTFLDVIAIKKLSILPFPLKNKSLIFTSVNAVDSFFENGFLPTDTLHNPSHFNKVYAVGKKTKKALRKYGFGTFKMKKNASDLADFILKHSTDEKFLHFCGNLALDILDKKLPLQNISYKKVLVYETELLYPRIEKDFDAVCFFSPSGVRSFLKNNSLDKKIIFSIGQTTEKEIKKNTNQKIITSKENHLEDLIELIKQYLNEQ